MSGRKVGDPATAKRLHAEGMAQTEIARIMGISRGTVYRYIKETGGDWRDPRAETLDRLGEQAHGFALAADQIVKDLPPAPDRYDVETWLSELNRVVKSARFLRSKLREKLDDG